MKKVIVGLFVAVIAVTSFAPPAAADCSREICREHPFIP